MRNILRSGFVILVMVIASTHAYSVHLGNVDEKIRLLNPTFMMLEQLLNIQDENQCIEKLFCVMEAEMPFHVNNPLKHYSRFLTNNFNDIEQNAFSKIKKLMAKYPHVTKIVEAIILGKTGDGSEVCGQKYEGCTKNKTGLIAFAKMMDNDFIGPFFNSNRANDKRGDRVCDGTTVACSLAGGGCALCTVATEGACALLCAPELGAACAGAGLGCVFG